MLRNLYDNIAYEFNRVVAPPAPIQRSQPSPNAHAAYTPAVQPQPQPPANDGVVRPFPGGAIFAPITLNGSGNGTASSGPLRVKEHWQVSFASVAVATAVKQATCSIYVGTSLSSATFVSTTTLGSSGATCGINQDLQPGQSVFAVWSGGDAGEVATLTIFGTYSIGAPQ
jgi:hypothetical protein